MSFWLQHLPVLPIVIPLVAAAAMLLFAESRRVPRLLIALYGDPRPGRGRQCAAVLHDRFGARYLARRNRRLLDRRLASAVRHRAGGRSVVGAHDHAERRTRTAGARLLDRRAGIAWACTITRCSSYC